MDNSEAVLTFWFSDIDPQKWWAKDPHFDQLVERHFGELLRRAARGECADWRKSARGRLAEIIVLDQFSRNIHRDTPQAFAQDPLALTCAQEAIRRGDDTKLPLSKRAFMYMPFMHSEDKKIHEQAVRLFQVAGLENSLNFELRHKAIIDRFGRYPHRNAILGRESTVDEIQFLRQPGSSF